MSDYEWRENFGLQGSPAPMEEGTLVDVEYRDGHIECYVVANCNRESCRGVPGKRTATSWELRGSPWDIIKWRYSPANPTSQPTVTEDSDQTNLTKREQVATMLLQGRLSAGVAPESRNIPDIVDLADKLIEQLRK